MAFRSPLKLISKAIKLTEFSSEENRSQLPRKGLEARAIVVCGGKFTFCYLPEKDEWKRLADGLSERNHRTKMISYCDQLYAFPYHDGKGERYDPVVNGWSTLDLATTRSTKVAVVRGEIYAIEVNVHRSTKKSTIKRYNIERCSWQTVSSSHEGCREGSCVVAADNHLYVCGGRIDYDSVTKAERFDTVKNKWEEIANMRQERVNSFGVATDGKIFLAGGEQTRRERKPACLKTCEMYNTSTNEWQLIGSLNVYREHGSMVCLKGTLYVLGGSYWQSPLSVECYDPTEDKWIFATNIPVKMISKGNNDTFTGCVLKLSKGVLDKLDVVSDNKKEDQGEQGLGSDSSGDVMIDD